MSADLERALVGAVLHDPEAGLAVCRDVLVDPGDIADPKARETLTVLNRLVEDGDPTDVLAVANTVQTLGLPWSAGASSYIADLFTGAPTPSSARYYAEEVAKNAHRRRLRQFGERLVQMSEVSDYDPAVSAARAGELLMDLEDPETGTRGSGPAALAALAEPGLDRLENPDTTSALSTGTPRLDKLIHGLRPGQLIVVAARPSIGKTTMALALARAVAIEQRQPTLMFSLEMTRDEVFDRIVASEARVPLSEIIDGTVGEVGWQRIARSLGAITDAPLLVDDTPDIGLGHIRSATRRAVRRSGVRMVVIDYLGLLAVTTERGGSRERAIAGVTRGLKLLAKSLHIPVVLVAQLNRDIEKRADKDKTPMLSDLRESGAIENDADVVLLLHREDFYKPKSSRVGEIDVIVGKNRNGPTGTVDLIWSGKYARISESDLQLGLGESDG